MGKRICMVTSTRADWGILRPLAEKLKAEKSIEFRLLATGMHLSGSFGYTYHEIEKDGFRIDDSIAIQVDSDTTASSSKSMGLALISFGDYFEKNRPDLLIVLGDRSEIFAVCAAAVNSRIPIAHLHGGETTRGAVDEFFRHSITKMSYLHFTSCEAYRRRVIQLGEDPGRVFNVGALGLENIKKMTLMSQETLSKSINFDMRNKRYGVVTFHPATLDLDSATEQCKALLEALAEFPDIAWLCTMANSDAGGMQINRQLVEFADKHQENVIVIKSLGNLRYLSALKYAEMVVGNSSSGILEAPSLQIPTVNIGDRQAGRIQAASILNCAPVREEISKAIRLALDYSFRKKCFLCENPYEQADTSNKIVDTVKKFIEDDRIQIKKSFFDLPWQ